MKNIFVMNNINRSQRNGNHLNLKTFRVNQSTFGTKSLKVLGPSIWNNLPSHIKTSENLVVFKKLIKKWNGISCNCSSCKYLNKN